MESTIQKSLLPPKNVKTSMKPAKKPAKKLQIITILLYLFCNLSTSNGLQFDRESVTVGRKNDESEKSENSESSKLKGEILRPIVLVPGILGSVLEAKLNKSTARHYVCYSRSDWFKIWLTSEVLVPLEGDCWVDNLKLDYHPISEGGVTNTTGVEIRAPNFGTPKGSVDYRVVFLKCRISG